MVNLIVNKKLCTTNYLAAYTTCFIQASYSFLKLKEKC